MPVLSRAQLLWTSPITEGLPPTVPAAATVEALLVQSRLTTGISLGSKEAKQLRTAWESLAPIGAWAAGFTPIQDLFGEEVALELSLPYAADVLVLERPHIDVENGVYVLSGNLVPRSWRERYARYGDAVEAGSSLFIASHEGQIQGHAIVGDRLLKIRTIGGVAFMFHVIPEEPEGDCHECDDTSGAAMLAPGGQSDPFELGGNHDRIDRAPEEITTVNGATVCDVDLAFGFTQAMYNAGYNTYAEGNMIVVQMNDALTNSQIPNFRYRFAGQRIFQAPALDQPNKDPASQLAAAEQDLTGEVANYYAATQTDQLMMVIEDVNDGFYGISQLFNSPNTRILTCARANTFWRHSGVHELGHNHGCKHDNHNEVGGTGQLVYSARGFAGTSTSKPTIMALAGGSPSTPNGVREPYFSSPDVQTPVGVLGTGTRDNRAELIATGCEVAALQLSAGTPHVTAYPQQTDYCSYEQARWIAGALCNGAQPDNYVWEVSYNGGGWQHIATTTNNVVSYTLPQNVKTTPISARMRVTVNCGGTTTLSDIDYYYIYDCLEETPEPGEPAFAGTGGSSMDLSSDQPAAELLHQDNGYSVTLPGVPPGSVREVRFVDLLGRTTLAHYQVGDSPGGAYQGIEGARRSNSRFVFVAISHDAGVTTFKLQ